MLHACIAQTSERNGIHGCVHRVANYFCRVAAKGRIRITSGHNDRRNSIVCELDLGHVTGPLKTLTYRIPGNGSVALTYTGFMSGDKFVIGCGGSGKSGRAHIAAYVFDMYTCLYTCMRNALVCTWLGLCGVTMILTPAPLYVQTS